MLTPAPASHLLIASLFLTLGACAGSAASTLSATQKGAPRVDGSAPRYSTELRAGGALGEGASSLRDRVLIRAREAGQNLVGDARLAELSRSLSNELGAGGRLPSVEVVDFFSHHLGLPSPETHVFLVGVQPPESLEDALDRSLQSYLARERYDRFGLYAFTHEGVDLAIVALIPHLLELAPFPRTLPSTAKSVLSGELREGLRDPELIHLLPDGRSETQKVESHSGRFDQEVDFRAEGIHRLQLTAVQGAQRVPIATLFVAVGVEHPRELERTARRPARKPSHTPHEVEASLLDLLNTVRKERGLESLERDEALTELARSHSEEMRTAGFLGHSSPTHGDPGERVEAAGVAASLILENIGRGESAEDIHRALLGSPGHRRNLLHPEATKVGVGVVKDGEGGYLATQIFIRPIQSLEHLGARAALIEGINRERQKRGRDKLVGDPNLDRAASEAATAYLENESLSHQDALRMARERTAQLSVTFTRIGSVMTIVSELEEAEDLDSLMVDGPTHIGIGLAQGKRAGMPRGGIVIVAVLGYGR